MQAVGPNPGHPQDSVSLAGADSVANQPGAGLDSRRRSLPDPTAGELRRPRHPASLPHAATSRSSARSVGSDAGRFECGGVDDPCERAAEHLAAVREARPHHLEKSLRGSPLTGRPPETSRRSIPTITDSTFGRGMKTVGGTMPEQRRLRVVGDLYRHRPVGRVARHWPPVAPPPRAGPSRPAASCLGYLVENIRYDRSRHVVRKVRHERPRCQVARWLRSTAPRSSDQSSASASPWTTRTPCWLHHGPQQRHQAAVDLHRGHVAHRSPRARASAIRVQHRPPRPALARAHPRESSDPPDRVRVDHEVLSERPTRVKATAKPSMRRTSERLSVIAA